MPVNTSYKFPNVVTMNNVIARTRSEIENETDQEYRVELAAPTQAYYEKHAEWKSPVINTTTDAVVGSLSASRNENGTGTLTFVSTHRKAEMLRDIVSQNALEVAGVRPERSIDSPT